MSTNKPVTPAEYVARAKEELSRDGGAEYAIAYALVAIAETMVGPVEEGRAETSHDCPQEPNDAIRAWVAHNKALPRQMAAQTAIPMQDTSQSLPIELRGQQR